jgi:hypothetical protein
MVVANKQVAQLLKDLHINNPIIGHAYLVDGRGRIRWMANSAPSSDELATLSRAVHELQTVQPPEKKTGGVGGGQGGGKKKRRR